MPIKTFEEACKKKTYDPKKILPDVSMLPADHRDALIATFKMYIIAEVLNDGWKPDWNNDEEYKYFPWFWMDKPGFRFLAATYAYTCTYSAGGSRLCFKTRKLAEYAGKTFLDLYRDMMVLPG